MNISHTLGWGRPLWFRSSAGSHEGEDQKDSMSMYVKILKANKLKNTCRERGIKRLFVVITYNKFIHLTFIGLAARDTEIKGFEA